MELRYAAIDNGVATYGLCNYGDLLSKGGGGGGVIERTCLRRDSIIASFCLIWARRYSRLLDEGTVNNSSSSEEAGDKGLGISGTDVVEEAKVDPLYGIRDPVSDRRRRGENILWGAPRLPTLHHAAVSPCLAPFTNVLVLRKVALHLKRCRPTRAQTIGIHMS